MEFLRRIVPQALRSPFTGVVVCCFLLLWAGEQYPFSNFPMYAGLSRKAELIKLTDYSGALIPLQPNLRTGTGSFRKRIRTQEELLEKTVPDEKQRQLQATRLVLDYHLSQLDPADKARLLKKGLILQREEISISQGFLVSAPILSLTYPPVP